MTLASPRRSPLRGHPPSGECSLYLDIVPPFPGPDGDVNLGMSAGSAWCSGGCDDLSNLDVIERDVVGCIARYRADPVTRGVGVLLRVENHQR